MTTEIDIQARTMECEADWDDAVRLWNTVHPTELMTSKEFRAYHTTMPDNVHWAFDFLSEAGEPLAYGYREQNFWSKAEGQYSIAINGFRDPDFPRRARVLLEHEIAKCRELGAQELLTDSRTDWPEFTALLEEMGFRETMRFPDSLIDLERFDATPFQDKVSQVEAQGIRLVPFKELADADPDGWIRKRWEFGEEVKHDIPTPDGLSDEPLEEFAKWVTNPDVWTWEGRFMAVQGDEWVACSDIKRNKVDPRYGNTGLTAVRRPWRRLGVATALKVKALTWAKENGMLAVSTGNEANNPMFQLNLALGFRDQYFWIAYRRGIDG